MLLPSLGVLLLLLRPPPLVAAVAAAPAFVFGAASAAWQYEGALAERGPSIWEAFCGGATPAGAPRCRGGGGNIAARFIKRLFGSGRQAQDRADGFVPILSAFCTTALGPTRQNYICRNRIAQCKISRRRLHQSH